MGNTPRAQHGARGQRRREEVVRAALAVIGERGFRGMSLAIVSEKVGLTQQGLLHYFPSREHLLIAVLQWRDDVDQFGVTTGDRTTAGPLWTVDTLPLLVAVNTQRPELVRLFSVLLGESVTDEHPASGYFRDRYEISRTGMTDALRDKYGPVLPSGLDCETVATMIVALLDGLQYQWLHDPKKIDMEHVINQFLTLVDPDWDAQPTGYSHS